MGSRAYYSDSDLLGLVGDKEIHYISIMFPYFLLTTGQMTQSLRRELEYSRDPSLVSDYARVRFPSDSGFGVSGLGHLRLKDVGSIQGCLDSG